MNKYSMNNTMVTEGPEQILKNEFYSMYERTMQVTSI
jgi:hypothetical protein